MGTVATGDTVVLVVFAVVHLGMLLGEIPGLALDRTGVALLGALVPAALGLLCVWRLILFTYRGRFRKDTPLPAVEASPLNR
jgi:hypothetical protein